MRQASGICTTHCRATDGYKRMEKRPGVNSAHRMFAPEEKSVMPGIHQQNLGFKMEIRRESQREGGGTREGQWIYTWECVCVCVNMYAYV